MSTKNIRKALQIVVDAHGATHGGVALAALREVEAIERAAVTFRELHEIHQCSAEGNAHMVKTLVTIAREDK